MVAAFVGLCFIENDTRWAAVKDSILSATF